MSSSVLARDAARKMTAAAMPQGDCVRRGRLWRALEFAHRKATQPEDASNVIAAIQEEYCGNCPARLACHNLAQLSQYTGLAAGAAYEKGQRKEANWVAPKAGRATTRAGRRAQAAKTRAQKDRAEEPVEPAEREAS
ncbi:hypothetical protein ACFVBP_10465 [Nocardioides sp. NPDC057764]|uniref:hypothetical protein n=1 Tax=Nocardioides sp. NPDC057764 TaxID=3346243 RepID=UPI00366C61A6